MVLLEAGYRFQKFFPAEPSGGVAYLSALASPLPQVKFCPTGGLTQDNAPAISSLRMSSASAARGWRPNAHRRSELGRHHRACPRPPLH